MTTILSSNITLLVLIDAQLLLNLIEFLKNAIHREILLLGFSGSIRYDFSFLYRIPVSHVATRNKSQAN